jgi:hypothetical protein
VSGEEERPVNIASITADDLTTTGRYLAGQLSREEREAFEEQFRRDPDAMQTLEATARLKVGLAKLRERGELDELLTPDPWYRRGFTWAAAAMIAIAALGIMLTRQDSMPSRHQLVASSLAALVGPTGVSLPVTAKLAVFRKRASSPDAVIETSSSRVGAIEMRVLPETAVNSHEYKVTLARVADNGSALTPVAVVDDLRPADDGFVTLFIDSSQLRAGQYRLDIAGEVPAGSVAPSDTFLIRVVPASRD